MDVSELVTALRRMQVETGSLVCLGCGHEHNCNISGCALIKEAAEQLEKLNRFLDGQCGILLAKNGALMTAMQAINNAAMEFVEGGPYHDGEATAALFAQAVYELSSTVLDTPTDSRPAEEGENP